MVDIDRNRKRVQRIQELKAQDSTMTSSKGLDIIRREEAEAERASRQEVKATKSEAGEEGGAAREQKKAAKVTEAAEGSKQKEAEEETRAAKETEKAEKEKGKAAKKDIDKDKEDIKKDKAEENFLKKLMNQNKSDGSGQKESAHSGASWVSIALIIIGFAEYLLRIYNVSFASVVFVLSLFLFILSGIAVANFAEKKKLTVLIPMLAFVLWYFVFGANYDPSFLIWFGAIFALIVVATGVITKGEGVKAMMLGAAPVAFFFLDIGLIPFFIETLRLPITPLMQNLVLFTPWWALLGIFTLPETPSRSASASFLITLVRIVGIMYIVFVLVTPAIPGLGTEKSLLPQAGEFEAAQQRLRAAIPQRENPAYSQFWCILFGEDKAHTESCVAQRQENSELTYICEKIEQKEQGTPQFTQCLEEQRQKKKSAALQVQGAIDPTIREPTKADITINKESFPTTYNAQFPFPFELKIENPRKLPLGLDVTCNFEGKSGTSSVEGRIEGAPSPEFKFQDTEFKSSYLCLPQSELKGRYTVRFNATIKDIVTVSRLQRAFVGDKSAEEVDRLRREEISKVIRNSESLAPADFAHINFDIGHAAKEIVIDSKDYKKIVVKGNIENTGSGKIVAVKRYEIPLEAEGFSVQTNGNGNTCLQGTIPVVTSSTLYTKTIALPTCIINSYPQELKPAKDKDWVPKTFMATLQYDYRITKDADIDIKPAEEAVS